MKWVLLMRIWLYGPSTNIVVIDDFDSHESCNKFAELTKASIKPPDGFTWQFNWNCIQKPTKVK